MIKKEIRDIIKILFLKNSLPEIKTKIIIKDSRSFNNQELLNFITHEKIIININNSLYFKYKQYIVFLKLEEEYIDITMDILYEFLKRKRETDSILHKERREFFGDKKKYLFYHIKSEIFKIKDIVQTDRFSFDQKKEVKIIIDKIVKTINKSNLKRYYLVSSFEELVDSLKDSPFEDISLALIELEKEIYANIEFHKGKEEKKSFFKKMQG